MDQQVFALTQKGSAELLAADTSLSAAELKLLVLIVARRASTARALGAGEKIHVVVVEDDAQVGKLLRMMLSMEGLVPRLASTRDEILAALRQAPKPDLVLLDVMLPDIDGFEVLARIRQHDALKSMLVIMLTARTTREAVLKGLMLGADGYITKPFDLEVLLKAVKTVLGLTK